MGTACAQGSVIKDEWEKFMAGKRVDESKISRVVFDSWKRSRSHHVDPFSPVTEFSRLREFDRPEVSVQLRELVCRYFEEPAKEGRIILSLFDSKGDFVTDTSGNFQSPGNNSEHIIGTNAVGLALLHKKPALLSGYENYLSAFHSSYTCAAPIRSKKGEVAGVLNISASDPEHIQGAYMFIIALAGFVELASSMFDINNSSSFGSEFVEALLDRLPQGLVCLDKSDNVVCYNQKLLNLLNIPQDQDARGKLVKYISGLHGQCGDRRTLINVNGVNTPFLASSRTVDTGRETGRIVFLEEVRDSVLPLERKAIYTFDDIIGKNERLLEAKGLAARVARGDFPILLHGESGTGKELFAQAIHKASPRGNGPFIAVNCGAIPAELVESELFGYEPGSFTGALRTGKAGQLELASGGTLFLDEIESMPACIQVKLLRVLSVGRLLKVGGVREQPIDIRTVSATKKDLLQEAAGGSFREDLYYRIGAMIINLPPLRERKDDIPLLVDHFLAGPKFIDKRPLGATGEFLNLLAKCRWGGNVRELFNVIEIAVCLLEDGRHELDASCLPDRILRQCIYDGVQEKLHLGKMGENGKENLLKMGEEIIIRSVLEDTQYDHARAARCLGISRRTLYYKIQGSGMLGHRRRQG